MKSSSGAHYEGLDHLRALAAFLVVLWHFSRPAVNTSIAATPEIGLIAQGHSGVALFMTLSGYLFAKLVGQRTIDFPAFAWNRALRLLPLFILCLLLGYLVQSPEDRAAYLHGVKVGWLLPGMPQGGWSIVVEMHFYLLLPMILWSVRRWRYAPLLIVGAALLLRLALANLGYAIETLAYYTLIGRIDQFALGIFAYHLAPRGRVAAAAFGALWLFYMWFAANGGYYGAHDDLVWVVLPTIEAAGFAALISWYDRHPFTGRWTAPLRRAGDYSYAVYLLHFLTVVAASRFVDDNLARLTSVYVAIPFALVYFGYMTMLGWASHRLIEGPMMRFRRPYLKDAPAASAANDATDKSEARQLAA
ncbi:acyltransferase [Sphingomonas humi]|uniref:Acyltransferase n=1 Tax=Sphingomonas humi TaxID=335630 RepID=A0ABP7S024_9SPHN